MIEKINICKSFFKILDKLSLGRNPPEDTLVKARFTESRSLKSVKLYRKMTKIVDSDSD